MQAHRFSDGQYDVSYIESGQGPDLLLFLHGSCCNASYWAPQLADPVLKSRYRMIAIDLPGHGRSAPCGAPALYHPAALAGLVNGIVRHAGAERYLVAGLSFGTNIIGEYKHPLPGLRGLLLASPCIVNDAFPPQVVITPGSNGHVAVAQDPPEEELRNYAYFHEKDRALADRFIRDYRNTDPGFRAALLHLTVNQAWTDELGNIGQLNVPVCTVFGGEDILVNKSYLDGASWLWKGSVVNIAGAGHFVNLDRHEAFNALLDSFAGAMFR